MKIEAKCKICGKISSEKAMGPHLKRYHNQGMMIGTNWERIGKKTDNQKHNSTGTYKCKLCNKSYDKMNSITSHLRNVHKQGMKAGINWERSTGETKKVAKQKRQIIVPEMKYIDIPVTLRIPLTLGQVQIISMEEK